MKKPKPRFEYQWNIIGEDFRTEIKWGKSFIVALADRLSVVKAKGYKDYSVCRLNNKTFAIKVVRVHKHGVQHKTFYVVKLNNKRLYFCLKKFHIAKKDRLSRT